MMFGSTTPQCDFLPLSRQDDDGDADTQEMLEDEKETRFQWTGVDFWRPCIWTICSATAMITTKRLMFTHGYHYPLTIAFRSFAAILVVYILSLRIAYALGNSKNTSWGLKQLSWRDFLLNRSWPMMLPASMAAAASFPMFLEGLLHMPSLPVIIMLFPLAYVAESVVLFICCSPSRSRKWLPWEAAPITIASVLVLYNEYRLTVPGLIWGVTGTLLMGLSRACFVMGLERTGPEIAVEARMKANHGFIIMTLISGFLFTGSAAYRKEHIHLMNPLDIHTKALMVVNILAMVGTAFSGNFLVAYTPISFQDPQLQFSNIPVQSSEMLASFASSLLVGMVSVYWHPTYISWVQIMAFLVSAVSLVGYDKVHDVALQFMDSTQQQFGKSLEKGFYEPRKPSRILTFGGIFTIIIFLSWTISSLSSASINALPPSLPATLDVSYQPQSQFDIVISMYQESPSSITSMIDKIKATTYLSTLSDIRVIIYTKSNTISLSDLKQQTNATSVHHLPNTGREGGTYLHHIVNSWDSLAHKTLFIQAHAHNIRELIPHLNSYLVPQTGMLSLGFTGVTCPCGECSDRWGWEDKWNVVPTLYNSIYGVQCESSEQITLSYKGQFIASAARIRGIKKKVYQGLLDAITSKDGWAHNSTLLEEDGFGDAGDRDSPSNPYFGFSVERIWGLLMQCGTDGRVASRCPTLLSGMGLGGEMGDCQCLDQ